MKLKSTVEKIVKYAVQIAEPEEIILFGSMAYDTDDVSSDVDLLIISDKCFNKKEVEARIKSFTNQLSLKTDILLYSLSELKKEMDIPNSFVTAIYKAGKIVYKN